MRNLLDILPHVAMQWCIIIQDLTIKTLNGFVLTTKRPQNKYPNYYNQILLTERHG